MSETHSVASSQRTSSSTRSSVGSRFFYSDFPVFPMFLSLESGYHYYFTYAGLLVQFLQMLAFVCNPHLSHGETLLAFSRAVYTVQLPFWDTSYTASTTWGRYLPLFCITCVMVVGVVVALLAVAISRIPTARDHMKFVLLRLFLHSITSWLFIPILQGLLSQMVCSHGTLWAFPTKQCFDPSSTLGPFVVGIVTFVLVCLLTYIVETTLYLDDYHSEHPLARKHYICDVFYTTWRIMTCALFQVFLSGASIPVGSYSYTWVPMYVFFSSVLMAASYVFFLPFIHQTTTRLFTIAFMELAMISIVVFFSAQGAIHPSMIATPATSNMANMDVDGLVCVSAFVLVFIAGWWLADYRLNREMTESLPQLLDAAAPYPEYYSCLYPKGLPLYDVAYRTTNDTSNDVADGAFVEKRSLISLETPFLTHVYVYTDVEVSTRFLSVVEQLTGRYPTPEMLLLAARIYGKGILRFQESVSVILSFAAMINSFTAKSTLALLHCDRTNTMACTFPTRYHSFRMLSQLKLELLRDTTYQRTCDEAKRAHKEILVSLYQFWSKLISQQDANQLLTTYSSIARKREDTNRMFVKALEYQTNDRYLLLKYADFLEQVMLQPERAEKLRAFAKQAMEQQRLQGVRQTKQKQRTTDFRQLLEDTVEVEKANTHVCGIRMDVNNMLKALVLFLIFGTAVGMLVTSVIMYIRRRSTLRCVEYSSTSRNLRMLGDLLAMQYWNGNGSSTPAVSSSASRLHSIQAVADDMLSIHNYLSYGLDSKLSGNIKDFWLNSKVVEATYVALNTAKFRETSFLGLGYSYVQFLSDIPGVLGRNSTGGGPVSEDEIYTDLSWLFDSTTRAWATSAYNTSVLMCKDWYTSQNNLCMYIMSGLFGFSLVCIVLYAELASMSNPVEKLKKKIISLFMLIPRRQLQEMANNAKSRVEQFDRSDAMEDDGVRMQEVELAPANSAAAGNRAKAHDAAELDESGVSKAGAAGDKGDATGSGKANLLDSGEDSNEDDGALHWEDNGDRGAPQPLLSPEEKQAVVDEGASFWERNRTTAPVAMGGYTYIFFFVCLVIAHLVVSIFLLTELNDSKSHQSNIINRVVLYNQGQEQFLVGAYGLTCMFQSGTTAAENTWGVKAQSASMSIPNAISLSPTLDEVVSLRDVGSAISLFLLTMQQPALDFWRFKSSLTTTFDMTTMETPVVEKGEMARFQTFQTTQNNFILLLNDTINTLTVASNIALEQSNDELTHLRTMEIVAIGIGVACIIGYALLLCYVMIRYGSAYVSGLNALFIFFAMGCLIGSVVLSSVTYVRLDHLRSHRLDQAALASEYLPAVMSFMWPLLLASNINQLHVTFDPYVSYLNPLFVLQYFDLISNNTQWEMIRQYMTNADATQYTTNVKTLIHLEMVSLALMCNSTGFMPLELENFTWDFDSESDAMYVRLHYPDDTLRYSTSEYDYSQNVTYQNVVARNIISNQRIIDLVSDTYTLFINAFAVEFRSLKSTVQNDENYVVMCAIIRIALSGTAAVMLIISVIIILYRHTKHMQELSDRGTSSAGLVEDFTSTFETSRVFIALGIVFVCVVAIFVLALVELLLNQHRAEEVYLMNMRSFFVTSSMIAGEMWAAEQISVPQMQGLLQSNWGSVDYIRTELSTTPTNVFSYDKGLSTFLQGSNVQLSEKYRYGFDPVAAETGTPIGPSVWTFMNGVENALATWMQESTDLSIAASTGGKAIGELNAMRGTIMRLLRGLDEGSHIFLSFVEKRVQAFFIAEAILCILLLIVIVGMLVIVSIPVARRQAVEEMAYRMLVRLIPGDVRESIPAIRDYMAFGLDGEKSLQGDDDLEEVTLATIAINRKGTVIKFNRHAEELFGYAAAEVLGNNVSLLMSKRIGARHTSFIERYMHNRKPTHRRIFRNRELYGQKKNGEMFMMHLTVYEMRRSSGDFAFIGFIEDVSARVERKREEGMSRFILEHVTVPMIAIDTLGTVLRFNHAAEECFGRSANDVINQNVKMLMPEDVAAKHDTYLATYLRTKQKHIIDTVARVHGVRKKGEEFPMELKVKEIICDNVSTYLGFCRDLTDDAELEEAIALNNAMMEASVIPVICTDLYGRVVLYSKSAERVFGYTAEEVLNNNCKMLMPASISDHHDDYLEQYRASWNKRASTIVDREVMGRHKNGQLIPLLAMLQEVKSSSSMYGGLLGFFRELSDQRALERSLNIEDVAAEFHAHPLIIMNSQGIIQRVNRAAVVEFGFSREELLQSNVSMLMPDAVAAHHDEYLARYMITGVTSVIGSARRVQAQRKDGTLVPVELRVREVRDSDGSNVLFVGFLRVLTRDLRMERQLLINRMTMESSLSPLAAIDADGAILQCNELLEKMLKYNRGDLIGMQINGLLAGEEEVIRRDGSKLATERVLNDVRTPLGIPVRRIMLATDGTRIPVDAKAQEVKAAKGGSERSSFLVLIHDTRQDGLIDLITSRNASVGQLSPVPLMEFDLSGRIVRFNKAAETKLQWTKDEVVGMNASSLFVNPELFSEKIAKASETAAQALTEYNILNADVAPTTFRTMVQTKKGETFPAQVSMCEIVADQDVKMNTFVMFIEDVTETMRLQQVSRSCHVYTELSPHALVVCTASGAIISCNSATCRIFHYRDVNELIGKDVGVLMPDSLAAHHRNFLSVYQKTGEARRIGRTTSVQCKRSDGVLFVCQLMVHEIKKSNAAETIYVGCLMDQTENAEMDHARRTLESMLKLSSDAIIFMDEAGVIQQANEVAMRLFGFSSMSSFVGKNIESMVMEIRSRDPDNTLGAYALHDSKSSRRRTVQCLRHDKSIFDAELTVQELHYRETRMYAACFSDCEATTTLHGRRKLNMAVAENCPVPVVVINSVGTVESFSPAAEAFFGYSAAEVIGGNVRKLMPPADAQRHDSYLRMYNPNCESSVVGKSSPQQARLSNGEIVPVNLHVKEIAGDDGHSSFVGFFIDRQTEAAFDKAIERGGAVARGSMEPLLVVSNSGTILHVNSALEQQFAYTRSELVGQRVSVLVPESILVGPKNNRSQWHVQRGTVVVSKDGRQREVDVLVTRALQDDGDAPAPRMNEATHAMDSMWQRPTTEAAGRRRLMPVYYVLLLDSASAFRFARTEQRYDSLMNYVKDFGIIEVELGHNRSLTVVRANQAAGNMLGRRVQELAGVSLQTLVGDSSVIRQLVHFAETKEKEGTATATSGMEDVGPKQRIMTTTTTLKGPTGAAECPCEITAERISTESIIIHMRESWKEHQNRMKGALVDALRGTIAEAYIIVNDEDDVVSINEAGSQLLGFTDGQHLAAHHIIDGGVVELYEGKGTTVSPTDARSSGYRTVHLDMATSSALGDVTDGVCHRKITDQFADTVRTIIQSNEVRRRVYVKRSDGSRLFAEVTLCPVQLSTSMMSSVPSRGTPGFSQELSRRTSVSSGQQASVTYYVVFIKDPSFMQQLVSATQIGTSILESSPGAIVVTDVQGLVVKFNAAAERLFLFERHHIIGKSVKMLMRDVDAARHDEFMMAYMQTKTRHVINSTRRVTAERRDGSAFVADLFLKEVVDDRGNPFMFVGYFKEVKNAATR